jgi:hypothetical protein
LGEIIVMAGAKKETAIGRQYEGLPLRDSQKENTLNILKIRWIILKKFLYRGDHIPFTNTLTIPFR